MSEDRNRQDRLVNCGHEVLTGKPVIYGTRITVELILEKLAAGESYEQLIESYPRLTRGGILAALEFAAEAMKAEVVHKLPQESA